MKKRKTTLRMLASFAIACIHFMPFYILLTVAFKKLGDGSSKWKWPDYVYFGNFKNVWLEGHLGQAFANNIVITVCSVILVLLLGSGASYPLARHKTRLNRLMYNLFVSALIVPPLAILVPLYKFVVDIGGMNSAWTLILLHVTFGLPITIFLFTGFINTIPKELDEAAMIDGLSRFRLFFQIIMPLLKPVTVTVTILVGVGIWNDYQFSVFFLQKTEARTISPALASFFSQSDNNVGWVAAGALMSSIPAICAYLFLQKRFVSGLSSGAVKG